MHRYVCIHGHFYQPPRENPWLEYVERQDSAYPYHDWNERITAECYGPNGRSRILDREGNIQELVNNYSWISFNIGPTLLGWLEDKSPTTYQAIQEADQESQKRFSGHGSALAQAYNHMILPLSNRRDQLTQVKWGIADFESRFGRKPEGMWLPETAANTASLEALAENGIRFTILAPRQARRVRPVGSKDWTDVTHIGVDPTKAYLVKLPSGHSMVLFFYDGPISQALAFERLLENGETFANRLVDAFRNDRPHAQLVHIATDGETYGHHKRHAEMALSYALQRLADNPEIELTNYGEYLGLYPPEWEVEIVENSSWSCAHGVERWRSDCGCNTGGHPGWDQAWRGPLRDALDWLREQCAAVLQKEGKKIFVDPWRARDRYIQVILDRSPESVERFFKAEGRKGLNEEQRVAGLQLMEMQRHAMLMYTSCGWFFDELSGIETVQIIQYAARSLQLAERLGGGKLEEAFLDRLEKAHSNLTDHGDGRSIYDKFVRPAAVDLTKVAGHYAVSSLFEPYPTTAKIYSHTIMREDHFEHVGGRRRLALGRIRVQSDITHEAQTFSYGVLHLGDHNISGGVREYKDESNYDDLRQTLIALFRRDNVPEMIRAVDRLFGETTYSLQYLFRDEQQKIVRILLESALEEASALYRTFYREYGPLARFLTDLGVPLPRQFRVAIDLTLQDDLEEALSGPQPDPNLVESLVEQLRTAGISLDTVRLEFAVRHTLESLARKWLASPGDFTALHNLERALRVLKMLPFQTNLWTIQNCAYAVMQLTKQDVGDGKWREGSAQVARSLGVAVE